MAVNERYYNEESGYGVFNIRTSEHLQYSKPITKNDSFCGAQDHGGYIVSVVGKMQHLNIGAEYAFTAVPEYSKKYDSWQYKPISVISIAPKTLPEAKAFLSFILSEKQADVLLQEYPNIIDDVINNRAQVDLSKLKGIGEVTWKRIQDKILGNFVISDLITLLQPYGVTYAAIMQMLRSEENPALLRQKIMADPYLLTQIHGFGFKKVDVIALRMKPMLRDSSKRAVAFIKYYLGNQAEQEGNTWVPLPELRNEAYALIREAIPKFDELIEAERKGGLFLKVDGNKVGLKRMFEVEESILEILRHLDELKFNHTITENDIESGIKQSEKEQGFEFSEEQMEVVHQAFQHNVVMISGRAGSGKSSIARAILNIYNNANCTFASCSLSAKAAQRIQEATGFPAQTMHRLLGCKGETGGSFTHNHDLPLEQDVIFLDESSMVNASLLRSLLDAVKPGSRVILCGDYLQLPPIGCGNPFSDLLQMKNEFASFELKTVHRQAAKSGILTDANKIRDGEFPVEEPSVHMVSGEMRDMTYAFRDKRENMREIVIKRFLAAAEKDGIDNAVIVTPRRAECINSAEELNKIIQNKLFAPSVPCINRGYDVLKLGARVIQTVNNYDKDVMNGEMGYIHDVDPRAPDDEECLVVKYKNIDGTDKYISYTRKTLNQLSLAYALTVHKTQGSQWDDVIVVVDQTHYALLDSCLLYTAITRAKKKCLLVAEPNAFRSCILKNKNISRKTWLNEHAKENQT